MLVSSRVFSASKISLDHHLTGSFMAMAVLAMGGVVSGGAAKAAPVLHPNGAFVVDDAEIATYRGVQYCWYDYGWSGPGWYQCGYAWRRGFGWGGPFGWHGWRGGHHGHHHHHHPRPPRPVHPHPAPGMPGGAQPGGPKGGPGRPRA